MAKLKSLGSIRVFKKRQKKKRPGVHAKTKTSKLKQSRNYTKLSRGQGS
jgi:hypothetical protein